MLGLVTTIYYVHPFSHNFKVLPVFVTKILYSKLIIIIIIIMIIIIIKTFMQDDHFSYKNCYQHGSCVKKKNKKKTRIAI